MSGPNIDKHRALVDRLHARVLTGTIEWTMDDFEPQVVLARMSNYFVELREGANENGEPLVLVVIRSSDGKSIETFSDEDITGKQPSNDQYLSYWVLMEDLLARARRQASGVDKAIDDILDYLEDIPF